MTQQRAHDFHQNQYGLSMIISALCSMLNSISLLPALYVGKNGKFNHYFVLGVPHCSGYIIIKYYQWIIM
jgi:hypothetical protein